MEHVIRILIIDDNPDDRSLAARALLAEFPGAAIDASVTTAAEMARAIESGGFDAVVTDYQLRWATGLDVLRRVKAAHPHCPVVMFTNTGTEEVAVEGMKAGLDDYVIKSPRHFARLAVAVRGALGRARFAAERERVMAELARAKEQAEAANRLKDEFLAVVSHELRTPLNAILGWATLLRRAPQSPEDLGHGLETIERNARLQAQLIDDLLDISRVVSGRLRLELRSVDLRGVVDAAAATVRGAAEAKGITLDLAGAAPPVLGDPTRLQQVTWNLLSNAIKFTPPGGRVRVEVRRSPAGAAELVVADNGQGIDPAFLPHVFDRFRQADASITRHHGGLGVGLALVKNLVELHGGTVSAHSGGRGTGATLTVTLPLADAASPAPDAAAGTGPDYGRSDLTGVRVLVVDDEPDARDVLVRLLTQAGAVLAAAASAADAVRLVGSFRPQVLVCDVGMPDVDGYQFVRRLRDAERAGGRPPLPAIALTGFAAADDRDRSLAAGFQAHLPKPVDAAALVRATAALATPAT